LDIQESCKGNKKTQEETKETNITNMQKLSPVLGTVDQSSVEIILHLNKL
jgi:hypothetical protein